MNLSMPVWRKWRVVVTPFDWYFQWGALWTDGGLYAWDPSMRVWSFGPVSLVHDFR